MWPRHSCWMPARHAGPQPPTQAVHAKCVGRPAGAASLAAAQLQDTPDGGGRSTRPSTRLGDEGRLHRWQREQRAPPCLAPCLSRNLSLPWIAGHSGGAAGCQAGREARTWDGLLVLRLQDGVELLEAGLQALDGLLALLLRTREPLSPPCCWPHCARASTAEQSAGSSQGATAAASRPAGTWARGCDPLTHHMLGRKSGLDLAPVLRELALALAHRLRSGPVSAPCACGCGPLKLAGSAGTPSWCPSSSSALASTRPDCSPP